MADFALKFPFMLVILILLIPVAFVNMANIRVTSFQKKGKVAGNVIIRGTKPSVQNSQLLISSGVPNLDSLIGGGFPVGSLVLIDEDTYGTFSKVFMKYFLAEGITSGHAIYIGSKDIDPKQLVSELPGPIETESSDDDPTRGQDDKMTIAWRYQNLRTVSSAPSVRKFGHYFDLTTNMDEKTIGKANINCWSENKGDGSNSEFLDSDFGSLLQSINKSLEDGKFLMSDSSPQRNILRIGLFRLCSPLWKEKHFHKFLYCLRASLRNSYSTCLITVPSHLHQDSSFIEKCIHLSDISVKLESFTGTSLENNKALQEYHGFFHILKLAAINSLINYVPQTADLAFKLRRKRLVIEKLHLPPELEDSAEREQDDLASLSCSSALRSSRLDF